MTSYSNYYDLNTAAKFPPEPNKIQSVQGASNDIDPLTAFSETMERAGLILSGSPVATGGFIRVPTQEDRGNKKTGWYVLYDNGNFMAGAYGDFRAGDNGTPWSSIDRQAMTAAQLAKYQCQQQLARKQREAEQANIWAEAAKEAKQIWSSGQVVDNHPYLKRKQVTATACISTTQRQYAGWLMVPAYDKGGDISTIQFIHDDGTKKFLKGGRKKGCYHVIEGNSDKIYIAEGYATGLTLSAATGKTCIVAWDSGNLMAVAKTIKAEYPNSVLIVAGDNDHENIKSNVGYEKATAVASALGIRAIFPVCKAGESDFNDIHVNHGLNEVIRQLEQVAGVEEPLPLRPAPISPDDYPLSSLGPVMQNMARAIADRIRVPDAIAAQSVLSYASLAIQPHYDVEMLQGGTRPTSLFFMSILQSSGRKSSSDSMAAEAMNNFEIRARENYPEQYQDYKNDSAVWKDDYEKILRSKDGDKRSKLKNLGMEPNPPMSPHLIVSEPTAQALQKALGHSRPSMGLFSDEGGQFISGYANQKETQVTTAAILSSLWEGGTIRRTRVSDGNHAYFGRRLSIHLMAQNEIADIMLRNSQFQSQGLLSRFLCTKPDSLIGTRKFCEVGNQSNLIEPYMTTLSLLYSRDLPIKNENDWTLQPKTLKLDPAARTMLTSFYNEIEERQATGRDLAPLTDFAGKLTEHATRLAGVVQVIEKTHNFTGDTEITPSDIERGITLARYYLAETIRIRTAAGSPLIQQAEELKEWLTLEGKEDVYLAPIMQFGPYSLRQKAALMPVIKILEEHGYLIPHDYPTIVDGKTRKKVWKFKAG